jgi:transposase
MSKVTTCGIDLAKNVFSVHAVDGRGVVVLRKTVSRARLMPLIAQPPACVIGLEACSGAHEWAGRFARHGHTMKLKAPKFVAPYRKSGKNDGNDAEAICEAVSRPSMRFVPVKSVDQQAMLTLHRVRLSFVEEGTATITRIRGLLAEFGVVLPQRVVEVRRSGAATLDQLPVQAARVLADRLAHVRVLDERSGEYERELAQHARFDERAKRIQKLSGVGPISASAIVSSVAEAHEFRNGRQFAAWLGLPPKQYSTGGKSSLGRITAHGDPYLRTVLILGARSMLQTALRRTDRFARWALAVRARRGYLRACVAIAAKHARIVWAMLAKSEALQLA